VFPPQALSTGNVLLKYIPSSVTASDVPLEEIGRDGDGVNSIRAIDIWNEEIAPAFNV
jgi:hypothetical protein